MTLFCGPVSAELTRDDAAWTGLDRPGAIFTVRDYGFLDSRA